MSKFLPPFPCPSANHPTDGLSAAAEEFRNAAQVPASAQHSSWAPPKRAGEEEKNETVESEDKHQSRKMGCFGTTHSFYEEKNNL